MSTSTESTKELETRDISSLFRIYAIPAVISQVISAAYNLCDRIFLGQGVGSLALAGLAVTFPLMNIIHAFGSLVGAGAGARMSIVLGKKDIRWGEKILGNSMLLTFFFGFLFVTGGYLYMDDVLRLFGASEQTLSYAKEYMLIVLPGMFLTTLTFNLTGLIRSTGYPTRSMWILAGGALLNIGLDALFIFGFGWGIKGAAWATTVSMALSAVAAVLHFCLPSSFIRFHRHAWSPKLYIFRNILLIGLSPFLMNLASSLVAALLNHQLIRFGGDLAVGTFGIVNSYATLMFLIIMGLCTGMQPIAGYNYGAGRLERMRSVYLLNLKICVAVGVIGLVMAFLFPEAILHIFTPDEAMIAMGVPGLHFMVALSPLIAFTACNSQFFQSIDKPWVAIVTSLGRQVLFLPPMMYLIPHLYELWGSDGLRGVWASLTCSDFFGFLLALVLLISQRHVFRSKPADA